MMRGHPLRREVTKLKGAPCTCEIGQNVDDRTCDIRSGHPVIVVVRGSDLLVEIPVTHGSAAWSTPGEQSAPNALP